MAGQRRRRFVALVSVVAPAVLSAGLLVVSAAPAQAIEVQTRSPIAGEESVPVGTDVTVTFDVAARGVNADTFTLERIDGVAVPAVVSGSGQTWTLNPNANLAAGTSFTASLSGTITDEGGLPLEPASWGFTTGGTTPPPPPPNVPPTVTNRTPGIGEPGVSTLVTVSVTFSEEVQGVSGSTFTLERALTGADVPAVVFRRGTSNTWSLNPDDPLVDGVRYIVRLDGGPAAIRDVADNPLADTTWSFRTGGGVNTVRPRVVSRSPSPGALGVNRRTDVRVTFSEPVFGVDSTTFTLTNTRTGNAVRADVFRLGSSRQWRLDPTRILRRGTRYEVELSGGTAGISDVDGNALRFTAWTFRTGF